MCLLRVEEREVNTKASRSVTGGEGGGRSSTYSNQSILVRHSISYSVNTCSWTFIHQLMSLHPLMVKIITVVNRLSSVSHALVEKSKGIKDLFQKVVE